jgi:peptidoglycan/xylan/chitin deacetylase (PgdA/CDA1 family)
MKRFQAELDRYSMLYPQTYYTKARKDKPAVSITFDDGPSEFTSQILSILGTYSVPGTFFFLGERAECNPDVVREVDREGHLVGNHCFTHENAKLLSDEYFFEDQFKRCEQSLYRILNKTPLFYRPCYGAINEKKIQMLSALNRRIILWSVCGYDWMEGEVMSSDIVSNVMDQLHPGAIILLHDGGGDRSQTVLALSDIINRVQRNGYSIQRLDTLLNLRGYDE